MKNNIPFIGSCVAVIIMMAVFVCACLNDPYAAPAHYVITDPYCMHQNKDGKWEVIGLKYRCPPNTPAR